MADHQGRLIHEMPNPTEPHRPDVDRDPPPRPCIGCRGYHGGVGAEIMCLRASLLAERAARIEDRLTHQKEAGRLLDQLEQLRTR